MSAIAAERDFLLARLTDGDHTWVGRSSTAMTVWAMGRRGTPPPHLWPSDEGDLARCEETRRRAPAHLHPQMDEALVRFRRHVAEGGLYCRDCDNSVGHSSTRNGLCPACQGSNEPSGRAVLRISRGPHDDGRAARCPR